MGGLGDGEWMTVSAYINGLPPEYITHVHIRPKKFSFFKANQEPTYIQSIYTRFELRTKSGGSFWLYYNAEHIDEEDILYYLLKGYRDGKPSDRQ